MKIKGIDISEWQPDVNFTLVKKDGIKFVILREGCGNRIDKQFLKHVEGCTKNRITILGVYHFLYPLSVADARKEAKSCIKNLKTAGLPKDTVVFSDFEYNTVNNARKQGVHLTKTNCIDFTKAFLDEIQKAGYRTGIYANQDYYKNWYSKDLINDHIFWLAHYTTGDPAFPCVIQQYTSTGSVKGIKGNVDMNWYFQCASIVDVARGWIGGNKKEVIDTYNSHKPLPRGYKVKYTDPYCATFVSACAIKANVLDFPIECSCPEMIKKFQSMGKWMERDDYKPSSGDIIFYDWDDSGSGDNTGTADHVGIVEACDGVYIYVIEGNMGSDGIIGKRQIRVNAKYIRGFGLPNYATKITAEKKSVETIAKEVINGQWGNGSYRISALKTAGYDSDEVQKKVNDLLGAKTKTVEEVAQEVLDGKWGNGTTRKKKLTDAGYDYEKIQSAVNDLVKKKKLTYKVCLEEDHKVTGSYDLLAVDDTKDPKKLSAGKILCYVNYGMCEEPDKFKSILFGRNEDWEDEWWVDVTKDVWIKKIKDQVLKAKKRGFQGIWLDNGDIYWYVLEEMKDRSKASKIYLAMMEMCKWIRSQRMFLILNGADTFVSLLIDTKKQSCIDGINQETVFTKITSYKGNGEFTKQDPDEQKYFTDYCRKCKNAGLTVLLLEYGSEPAGLKTFQYADAYYVSKGLLL